MRFLIQQSITCVAILIVTSGYGLAATITFGNANVEPLGTYSENGFTFQVVSGDNMALVSTIGNPGSAFTTGGTPPSVGDRVDVFRTGGGLFTFDSFGFRKGNSNPSDIVNFLGEVNTVVTQSLLNFGSTSTTSWQNRSVGFSGPIDRLRIEIAAAGEIDLRFDNLNLTAVAVPEPSTFALLSLGACAAGIHASSRRCRRK